MNLDFQECLFLRAPIHRQNYAPVDMHQVNYETPHFPRSISLQNQLKIDDRHPRLVVVGLRPGKDDQVFSLFLLGGGMGHKSSSMYTVHEYNPYW